MGHDDQKCPQCGTTLRRHRADRQRAGKREVRLEWSICPSCRQVRLEHWEWFDEPSIPNNPTPE